MKISRIMRQLAGSLVLLMILQAAEATAQNNQGGLPAQTAQAVPSDSSQAGSQGAGGQNASTNNTAQAASDSNSGGAQQAQSPAAANEGNKTASSSSEQQSAPKPVGTAAAPALGSTGVAGSRPTGAVIAPAKQRRVRAILISVGVVVAACVAVGAVAALSHSSPSQPR